MRKLPVFLLLLLSLSGVSQTAPLSTFSKAEAKQALGFLSAQKPVSANSKFIFASGDMKGYIKVNGKIISLKHNGGTDSDTTGSSLYSNDQYSVLSTSRMAKMGKDKYDSKTIWEESIEIKDSKTKKILFNGKVYPLIAPKIPEKYSLLDKDAIDQVLADLVGGLKKIPQQPDEYNGLSSSLKILKGSNSESSILTDKVSYLTFTSYDFNTTHATCAKLLKEFLELKKDIAPFSEKEKTKTTGKKTVTSFIYCRTLIFAELKLEVEKISASTANIFFTISYFPNNPDNGREMLATRILDRLIAQRDSLSTTLGEGQQSDKKDEYLFTLKPPFTVLFGMAKFVGPVVTIANKKYTFQGTLTSGSQYSVHKFLFEIKKYMADKYKSKPLVKPVGAGSDKTDMIFSKFISANPGLEIRVRYFYDDKYFFLQFTLENTLTPGEITKALSLLSNTNTNTQKEEVASKPPLLKMFRDRNGLYGFRDLNNGFAVAIPAEYKFVGKFSEGLIAVTKDGDKWGYVDASNKLVIPFKFVSANEFSNGKALVEEGNLIESVKYYIDKSGKKL